MLEKVDSPPRTAFIDESFRCGPDQQGYFLMGAVLVPLRRDWSTVTEDRERSHCSGSPTRWSERSGPKRPAAAAPSATSCRPRCARSTGSPDRERAKVRDPVFRRGFPDLTSGRLPRPARTARFACCPVSTLPPDPVVADAKAAVTGDGQPDRGGWRRGRGRRRSPRRGHGQPPANFLQNHHR